MIEGKLDDGGKLSWVKLAFASKSHMTTIVHQQTGT